MTSRTAAGRYARALLEVTRKEGDVRAAERDLSAFVSLVEGDRTLLRVLVTPSVPAAKKTGIVSELLSRSPLSSTVSKMLLMMADRDRLALLPDVLDEYRQRLMELENVVRAEVTTATELSSDRLRALQDALSAMTGSRIAMTARVDPELIGGVVTRIGSVVYDGSVRRQLERLRETLTQ
jgi:F-type H+-transporting ATPase subunit delta